MKLVTGGSGFLGIELVNQLRERGEEVRVYDRTRSAELPEDAEFLEGDILDYGALAKACEGVDTVYHLVGIMPQARLAPVDMRAINVGGTLNVLRGCVEKEVRRMVFLSSSEVYGKLEKTPCPETARKAPVGEYGNNKVASELLCHEFMRDYGLEIAILRPTTIIGPRNWEKGINTMLREIKAGRFVPMLGQGENRFHLVHVADAASAAILAGEKQEAVGEAFNVGCTDKVLSLMELANSIKEFAYSKVRIIGINPRLGVGILKFLNLFGLCPMEPDHYNLVTYDFILDVTKIQEVLGWTPRFGCLETLLDMYRWYENTH